MSKLSRELADSLIGLAFILRKNGRDEVADELDRMLISLAAVPTKGHRWDAEAAAPTGPDPRTDAAVER